MSVYKLKRKTGANTTEDIQLDYNTCIANKPTIPSAVTSINGLSGGKLTSPLQISGGDATTAPKIALDQTASGQITNNATQTIFGFTSNNSTNLTVGHSSYGLLLRGSGTRPKFNSNDLALKSDIPDTSTLMPKSGGTFTGAVNFPNTATITAEGHFKGTWLYSSNATDTSSWTDVWVNNSGWLYKRAKSSFKSDLGVPSVWSGTQDQYDAITTKDSNTYYFIQEE